MKLTRALLPCLFWAILTASSVGDERFKADARLLLAKAEYGYWAPEMHEMYLCVSLKLSPIGGKEEFSPTGVTLDGKPVPYTFWYAGATTLDYYPAVGASRQNIRAFIPVTWRAKEKHEVAIKFTYEGKEGEQSGTFATPEKGGAWSVATGGNEAFLVREEAGLERRNEPVEFDSTALRKTFPDPEHRVRATLMTAPGVFKEIPCQVYDAEPCTLDSDPEKADTLRFRSTVQLSVKPRSEVLVHLWSCPPVKAPKESPIRLKGGALGGTVQNNFYSIELHKLSGQIFRWQEKGVGTAFEYVDLQKEALKTGIHQTPDAGRVGSPWTHTYDWRNPEHRSIEGPVFVETLRWGPMPGAPELFSRVSYRFFSDRPDVRVAASLRMTRDAMMEGFRGGGLSFSPFLFTHIAWPRQDGSVVRVSLDQALGNDMGAPSPGRFPFDTPWFALYNAEKHFGFSMITSKLSYFSEGPSHPNQSEARSYVSLYRNTMLYTVRSANQTYCASVRSRPIPMRAGTVLYEDTAWLPFTFEHEDDRQFLPVVNLYRELQQPLVVVP